MNTKKTLTIGQMLLKVSVAENHSERKDALKELEEVITGHPDESFIRVCMDEACKGLFSANVGKCVPPNMDNEGISYHNGDFDTITAKW